MEVEEHQTLVDLIRRAQQNSSSRSKGKRREALDAEKGSSDKDKGKGKDISGSSNSGTSSTSASPPFRSSYTAAEFYVPTLPNQPPSLRLSPMYSGHLPASYVASEGESAARDAASDAHLFWLLVKARHIADREKLVLWFNGGPGCSSFDGAMLEIGPALVHGKGANTTLVENPGRWNEYANVLFIDQPAGTGYSYMNKGTPVTELGPAADQIVTFLQNFYSVFPEYAKMDTYIAGESYAGTTVPYLARAITSTSVLPTRLQGLLLGNGWFSPKVQYPAYVAYGRERGFLRGKNSAITRVEQIDKQCNETLASSKGDHVLVGVCEGLIEAVMEAGREATKGEPGCMASYDVRRLQENCGEYPSGLSEADPYLNRAAVKSAFHASAKAGKWQQCNSTVGSQMWSPGSRPSVELLPDLLEQMPMLFFAGDADLMCNWLGIEETLQGMTWKGATGFGNATVDDWYINGTLAGTWQTARNMTWVKVLDAGHMVPIDKPHAAHDILLRFIGIETLAAAGDHSQVPSRVGQAKDSGVLGKISPDGGTLPAVISQQEKAASAAAASAAAAVDLADTEGQPVDKERELRYGPRRSGVLLLIIFTISVGFYALLRWRARQRRARGWQPRYGSTSKQAHIGSHGSRGGSRSSMPSTPMSARGKRLRPSSDNLTEAGFLKRIDEHDREKTLYADQRLEEAARNVFAIEEEDEAREEVNPWLSSKA